MKELSVLFLGFFLAMASGLRGETLFGPGSISVATNEAILISTLIPDTTGTNVNNGHYEYHGYAGNQFFLDGRQVSLFEGYHPDSVARYAIAGPHIFAVTNAFMISFQRLQGTAIKTLVITNSGESNSIIIPAGKTVQFFKAINGCDSNSDPLNLVVALSPPGSTNVYILNDLYFDGGSNPNPFVTGPVTVQILGPGALSYYFTDNILQVPPQGLLQTPAPALEVDVEKSYNLSNWTTVGAFNTAAETGAYYRLKMLK